MIENRENSFERMILCEIQKHVLSPCIERYLSSARTQLRQQCAYSYVARYAMSFRDIERRRQQVELLPEHFARMFTHMALVMERLPVHPAQPPVVSPADS